MKGQLTEKQTQRLISLGIDKSKATGKIEVQSGNISEFEYRFTLRDLFEILPAEVYSEIRGDCNLQFKISKDECAAWYEPLGFNHTLVYFPDKELIDCLYKLVIWCVENKYLL